MIDRIADRVVRQPLQDVDLAVFDQLQPGDLLFMDGTHLAFSNTDATVFFLDVLPRLKPGVVIGVHDCPVPWDYPKDEWERYYFNEIFLLATYLLAAGDNVEILFPAFYLLRGEHAPTVYLDPILNLPALQESEDTTNAGAFWFRTRS